MTLRIVDQRNQDDGVTVEGTEIPGFIGWGETPTEAITNLNDQYAAIAQAIVDCTQALDDME